MRLDDVVEEPLTRSTPASAPRSAPDVNATKSIIAGHDDSVNLRGSKRGSAPIFAYRAREKTGFGKSSWLALPVGGKGTRVATSARVLGQHTLCGARVFVLPQSSNGLG